MNNYQTLHHKDVAWIVGNAIAGTDVVAERNEASGQEVADYIAERLMGEFAALFTADNPDFDTKRFRTACLKRLPLESA